MSRFLVLFLVFAASVHGVFAADDPKAARTCRILFIAPPGDAPRKILLHDGTSIREVNLPDMNLSEVYPLPSGDITLRMLSQKPADGQPLPEGAPKAAVGDAVRDLYLLVSSDPSNPVAPLRMQVVNANPDVFRKGQMLWYNLCPYQVGGRLGDRTLKVDPNARVLVDAPAAGNEDYPVKLGYLPKGAAGSEPICSTVWRHDPDARTVLFVLMAAGNRVPRILEFTDDRAGAKKD